MSDSNSSTKIDYLKQCEASKYSYVLNNSRAIDQEINGVLKPNNFVIESRISFDYKTIHSNQLCLGTLNFKTFSIDSLVTNRGSNDTSTSPTQESLRAFDNLQITITQDDQNHVKILDGYDHFKQTIDSIYLSGSKEGGKDHLPSEKVYTELFFIDLVKNKIRIISSIGAEKGSIWTSTRSFSLLNDKIDFFTTYKVLEVTDSTSLVELGAEAQKEIILQNGLPIYIKAIEKGYIKVESRTGMIMEEYREIKAEGDIVLNNQLIRMSIVDIERIKGDRCE